MQEVVGEVKPKTLGSTRGEKNVNVLGGEATTKKGIGREEREKIVELASTKEGLEGDGSSSNAKAGGGAASKKGNPSGHGGKMSMLIKKGTTTKKKEDKQVART